LLPPLPASIAGVIVGAIVYLISLRLTRALSPADLAFLDQGMARLSPAVRAFVRPIVVLSVGGGRRIPPDRTDAADLTELLSVADEPVGVPPV
jgi:hypothetical protein